MTNLDALWLLAHADAFDAASPEENAIKARLIAIATNLQRMDEANAILSANRTYLQGVADERARQHNRSNILSNPDGEDVTGAAILAQIERRMAEGGVKKVALGVRALEDKPHMFNAPIKKPQAGAKAKAKPAADLDLNLDILLDL